MGNRFRLLVNEVEAVKPKIDLPKFPVARVLWKPLPDMQTGCAAWILAGGAHHPVYSKNLNSECLSDFAEMTGIEMPLIGNTLRCMILKTNSPGVGCFTNNFSKQ
jgi:L-arabinose isomerase